MEKMMQLVLLSELVVKQLEEIKGNRTKGETVALIPYVKELEKTYNDLLPEVLMNSLVFSSLIIPLKKMGQTMNIAPKDGIEAQKRLQETYNMFRPVVDFISTKIGAIDEELEKKHIEEFTPAVLVEDLEVAEKTIREFIDMRPTIIAVSSPEELKKRAESLIEQAKEAGMPEDKIRQMQEDLERALQGG